MDYAIRQLTAKDEPILWEMLYQGLASPGKKELPARDIVCVDTLFQGIPSLSSCKDIPADLVKRMRREGWHMPCGPASGCRRKFCSNPH